MRSINKNLKKNRKSNKTRKRTFSKSKQTGGGYKAIKGPKLSGGPSRAGKAYRKSKSNYNYKNH